MNSPLLEASGGNGAEPCPTQTTTIRAVTDVKPIYYHATQGQGLEASPLYRGLGLVLFLVGAGLLGLVWLAVSLVGRLFSKSG